MMASICTQKKSYNQIKPSLFFIRIVFRGRDFLRTAIEYANIIVSQQHLCARPNRCNIQSAVRNLQPGDRVTLVELYDRHTSLILAVPYRILKPAAMLKTCCMISFPNLGKKRIHITRVVVRWKPGSCSQLAAEQEIVCVRALLPATMILCNLRQHPSH